MTYKCIFMVHVEPNIMGMSFEKILENPRPISSYDKVVVPLQKGGVMVFCANSAIMIGVK